MFRIVLFSCCCIVMKSVVVAAPTSNQQESTECKDTEIREAGATYPCRVLTDKDYPGQQWLGFYASNVTTCKNPVHNKSCCLTCQEVLKKSSTPQTTTTTTTTTEATPKNEDSEIEIIPQNTKFGETEYGVVVQQGQRPSDDVAMKITMEKGNKQTQEVLLRFHQKRGQTVIDLY